MLLFLCQVMPHWCRCTADVLIIGWVQLWDVKYLQEGDDEASEGVDTKQQASLGENTDSQGNGQTDSTIISGDDSDDEMEAEGSRRRKKKGKQPALPSNGKSKFFEDL
jgi:hypothetical protein